MGDSKNLRSVSVSEMKAQFSKMLDAVEAGETLIITRYGEPVAWLEPAVRTGTAQVVRAGDDEGSGGAA